MPGACTYLLCLVGQLNLTCPDAQGLQPQNISLDFSLQAWEASRPQAVPVGIVRNVQALPGQFQLSYNITKVILNQTQCQGLHAC